MINQREKNRLMTEMALLMAVIVILSVTPLGYIPLGFMNATTIHIPVIIAGIVLGWKAGALCGLVFGITSVLNATFKPVVTSFLFSPLIAPGNALSLVIAIVPRILIGVAAFAVFRVLLKVTGKKPVSMFIAGVAGSMTNTVLVMGMAYIFFAEPYAEKTGIAVEGVLKAVCGVMVINGIPEAIVAGIISSAVSAALMKAMGSRN